VSRGKGHALCVAALLSVYYFCGLEYFAAFIISVAVHELGHITALLLFGGRLRSFKIKAGGFDIEAAGISSATGELITILAGSAFGFALSAISHGSNVPILTQTGRISLMLSVYNLIPALPLDGGRVAERLISRIIEYDKTHKLLECSGVIFGIMAALCGSICSEAVLVGGGVWLIIAQTGIVKNKRVL